MTSEASFILFTQGAEARLYLGTLWDKPVIIKERFCKKYRHSSLDASITKHRIKAEAKAVTKCLTIGIRVPTIYFIDSETHRIYFEYFSRTRSLRQQISELVSRSSVVSTTKAVETSVENHSETNSQLHGENNLNEQMLFSLLKQLAIIIAKLHLNNIIHGDLTTSNVLVNHLSNDNNQSVVEHDKTSFELILIDFGLSFMSKKIEDKAVDLYVLERAFLSTHPNTEKYFEHFLDLYKSDLLNDGEKVIFKLNEVRTRGRKREMVG